ncbi:hypothetical protein SRHO_G00250920 [Serrasalmus rhombeus]
MLETKTVHIEVEEAAVLPRLRSLERKLAEDPQSAVAYHRYHTPLICDGTVQGSAIPQLELCAGPTVAYRAEIQKLLLSGSVMKLKERPPNERDSWFIPHHMVSHNAKNRISLPSAEEARKLIDKLRALLTRGGFELRQWSSNVQSVTSHLPIEARSGSSEQWLAHEKTESGEGALVLSWNCPLDMLTYKSRVMSHGPATMRFIYKVLASQYDPLGYIIPFVTRAKVLVQRLWGKRCGWHDPLLPGDLLQSWTRWEEELSLLPKIHLPRSYVPRSVNQAEVTRELHIFCDAPESAYGAVESSGTTHLSFVMARSRVAPYRNWSFAQLIAEIHEITDPSDWRYVDSELNPADDVTRGKTLIELSKPKLSYQQFESWDELVESVVQKQHGVASSGDVPTAEDYTRVEMFILQRMQQECFGEDLTRLKAGKPLLCSSRLLTLAPSLDKGSDLIRVAERPSVNTSEPVSSAKDGELNQKSPKWQTSRSLDYVCLSQCSTPLGQIVSDLLWSRRLEKRWEILFKCLTTKAIHIEILHSLSTDSFLMSLRRFIARRGIPKELWSDQGTNFKGGEKEIEVAFKAMSPELQCLLAKQQIVFNFNPPAAPHFGGVWEREIRSIKEALYKTVGEQPVQEEILQTVLLEVESILNSRPLGYVSSDIADTDPVTHNLLLMGRLDSALPQVIYPQSVKFSQRKWRHAQVLADQFWSAFIRHYLPSLQARVKWFKSSPGIPVGVVVLVVDPQQPRVQWPIGKIVKVHPSRDGHNVPHLLVTSGTVDLSAWLGVSSGMASGFVLELPSSAVWIGAPREPHKQARSKSSAINFIVTLYDGASRTLTQGKKRKTGSRTGSATSLTTVWLAVK